MISYEEALRQVIATVAPLKPVETPLAEAAGLVLAAPATARWDMPRCDNSAMDGFAIAGGPAGPATGFAIVGASYAGHSFAGSVQAGQAVRITTGAALPAGADSVVPVEETTEKQERLFLDAAPRVGQHVRYRGEEFRAGDLLVAAGTLLRAGEIALLASAGVEKVEAFPRPRVAVISTGDELVALGRQPAPGQIVNSNLHLLRTRLQECGCIPVCIGIGGDDPATLEQLLGEALTADVIVSTGGVSIGDKDHVLEALEQLQFKRIFWKAAIKPGKPVLFGVLENRPYFGLPGNPAAAATTFELFVRPAVKKMAGHRHCQPVKRSGQLTEAVDGGGKRQLFLWCRLEWRDDGYQVIVQSHQGSGQNRSIQGANALLTLPVGTSQLAKGERVEVFLLDPA